MTARTSPRRNIPIYSPVARVIKKRVRSIEWDWKNWTDWEVILTRLSEVFVAVLIISVAHLMGKYLSQKIDAYVISTSSISGTVSRGVDAGEEDGEVEDEKGAMTFRSRNAMISILQWVVYGTFLLIGVMVVLRVLGIEVATIIASLGTIGFVIGFAVQGTLSDVASGVLLALFQTYQVGDIIKLREHEGRVIDFRTINTLMQDLRSLTLVTVPNRLVQESIVTNYSRSRYHAFVFKVRLSHENKNFPEIIDALVAELNDPVRHPEIYQHPSIKPSVEVESMDQPATILDISVPMTATADLHQKRHVVTLAVRAKLSELGVKMWPTR